MSNLPLDIMSDIIVYMKYAKYDFEKERKETWEELVDRNKSMHLKKFPQLKEEIEKHYELVYKKQVFPSMRSFQFAGEAIEKNNMRIYNCSYLHVSSLESFSEILYLLLCGTGVGFSVQKHHIDKLPEIYKPAKTMVDKFEVQDDIQGWADSILVLLKAYTKNDLKVEYYDRDKVKELSEDISKIDTIKNIKKEIDFDTIKPNIEFDYSLIRSKGSLIKSSNSKAPGYKGLEKTHKKIREILERKNNGERLTSLDCYDIICHVADCVLSGGIRRSSAISLFDYDDELMLNAKSGEWYIDNPQRSNSNNSAVFYRPELTKEKFDEFFQKIVDSGSGEPGIFLTNDPNKNLGLNPCAEVSLNPFQVCNLTEIVGSGIKNKEDFLARVKAATFIGTLQASYTDFEYLRKEWTDQTKKEALLGVSITGLASGQIQKEWLDDGSKIAVDLNKNLSGTIGINQAARVTLIKPSGCLTPDTKVLCEDGLFYMDELGDTFGGTWQDRDIKVHTSNGLKNSPKFYVNGETETKLIRFNSGLKIEGTLNHKIKVIRDYKLEWVRLDQLKVGDTVPYKLGGWSVKDYVHLDSCHFTTNRYASRLKSMKQPEILDEDLAYFLGQYYGDGSNHKKGIRIHGDKRYKKGFDRLIKIASNKFGIEGKILEKENQNGCELYFNSTQLISWLSLNGLSKEKSKDLTIPFHIRTSPKLVIESFIQGYFVADGSDKTRGRSYCTVSKNWAEDLTILLRSIGVDAKMRLMPPTKSSWGESMRYWVSERKLRQELELNKQGDYNYINSETSHVWEILDSLDMSNYSFDVVEEIEDSISETYDIEVEDEHQYFANSYISHNTTSLVASTSSGIHAWYAPYYIRRITVLDTEPIYKYLKETNPSMIETVNYTNSKGEYSHTKHTINIPIKAPEGAIFKEENEIDFLNRIKEVNKYWIKNGWNYGIDPHNVSCTVSVKDWDAVKGWMWENRDFYTAIALLPYWEENTMYQQLPHETITKERFEELVKNLKEIDLTKIKENDFKNLELELACSSGSCEII